MIASEAGIMPEALKFEADKRFFENGLDSVDVVVHGRHSHEQQANSDRRRRIVLTRRIPTIAVHPSDQKAVLWNPAGSSLEEALRALGLSEPRIGIIGGTDVFDLFLDHYHVFYLSRAPTVQLPGGRPVFRAVPARSPEEVLADSGLQAAERQVLDPVEGVTVVSWRRSLKI
jgi:dihydrofolate reductase